jgi:hypothetical protein
MFSKLELLVRKIIMFYIDGFRRMKLGKMLWAIILIKLFIMFAVLKLFFFRDFLGSRFSSDKEKSNYVMEQLTR